MDKKMLEIKNEDELYENMYNLTSVLNGLLHKADNELYDEYIDLKKELEKLNRFANENQELYNKYLMKLEEEEKADYIPF